MPLKLLVNLTFYVNVSDVLNSNSFYLNESFVKVMVLARNTKFSANPNRHLCKHLMLRACALSNLNFQSNELNLWDCEEE